MIHTSDGGSLERLKSRAKAALPAAAAHFAGTVAVAVCAAALVLLVWYPHPYDKLSGGRELFFLVVGVDIVCGPLLTFVLYDRKKPRRELVRDLSLVVVIQLIALGYGINTAREARPLFLVHEVERFRVIAEPDFQGAAIQEALAALPDGIRPSLFSRPRVVGTRPFRDAAERSSITFDVFNGGRDIGQRPEFYVPYDNEYARQAVQRARSLQHFIDHDPAALPSVRAALADANLSVASILFLPVAHRQDWIALLDERGSIVGFVPGDGFAVP